MFPEKIALIIGSSFNVPYLSLPTIPYLLFFFIFSPVFNPSIHFALNFFSLGSFQFLSSFLFNFYAPTFLSYFHSCHFLLVFFDLFLFLNFSFFFCFLIFSHLPFFLNLCYFLFFSTLNVNICFLAVTFFELFIIPVLPSFLSCFSTPSSS